jgi:ATP-citrate lyase beta-subunit
MAQKAIREFDAKGLLERHLPEYSSGQVDYRRRAVLVTPAKDLEGQRADNPWLNQERLVVKPDQLFGKRGKNGLLAVNVTYDDARSWIAAHMKRTFSVHRAFGADGRPVDEGVTGVLTHFLVEPLVPHTDQEEYYLAMTGHRGGDRIFFSPAGGMEVEENRDRLVTIDVPTGSDLGAMELAALLPGEREEKRTNLAAFIRAAFEVYRRLHFGFLEFNPLVATAQGFVPLDVKARLDDAAAYLCRSWGGISFPEPFGHNPTPEENYIAELDSKSGSSLKLTILNPQGRIWTMVAGGGASVIYTDTVVDLGFGQDLANYGEYSGDPTAEETREYTKTLLDLMTRKVSPQGKVLIIGGGIANFTDVSKTFDGVIEALTEYAPKLKEGGIRIYVRRAGPNYVVGLAKIREAAQRLGLAMEVYGPELHMTSIVKKALDSFQKGN